MNALTLDSRTPGERIGLKGPRAAEWLTGRGIALPSAPNSWASSDDAAEALLVARLGSGEFFLEDALRSQTVAQIRAQLDFEPAGVYPVLREDAAFLLRGEGVHDALSQVCNVDFASLSLTSRPIIMTLMIGVAVLVVPENSTGGRRYRIWCDPTFGPYLGESLGNVVLECGGRYSGGPA